jgi:guanylate kinase
MRPRKAKMITKKETLDKVKTFTLNETFFSNLFALESRAMDNAIQQNAKPVFLVVTAPSGAGKSTLIGMLRREFPSFEYSVSCTTRAPRGEERDGVAYHFISDDEFVERIGRGEFLEHAMVHGHRYGTLKTAVEEPLAQGRSVVMDIDVAGAAQVREKIASLPESAPARRGFIDVFIDVPSEDELRRRLVKRGEDAPETIERRLRNAAGERARRGEFSSIIVNDDLDKAYTKLRSLILQ